MTESNPEPSGGFSGNLIWGLSWGLFMAALFSGFVLLQYALLGSPESQALDSPLSEIMVGYFVGGLGGGVVLGVLRPVAKSAMGGTLVGAIIGTWIYLAVGLATGETLLGELPEAAFAGVLGGGFLGWAFATRQGEKEHGIIASANESPGMRVIQIIGVACVLLGATSCMVLAESEIAVSGGMLLFMLGSAAIVLSQGFVWIRRLISKIPSESTQR